MYKHTYTIIFTNRMSCEAFPDLSNWIPAYKGVWCQHCFFSQMKDDFHRLMKWCICKTNLSCLSRDFVRWYCMKSVFSFIYLKYCPFAINDWLLFVLNGLNSGSFFYFLFFFLQIKLFVSKGMRFSFSSLKIKYTGLFKVCLVNFTATNTLYKHCILKAYVSCISLCCDSFARWRQNTKRGNAMKARVILIIIIKDLNNDKLWLDIQILKNEVKVTKNIQRLKLKCFECPPIKT